MNRSSVLALGLALAVAMSLAGPVRADQPPGKAEVAPVPSEVAQPAAGPPEAVEAAPDDEWEFRVAVPLYAWWPNWQGTLETSDGSVAVDFDLTHNDVLDLIGDDFRGIWTFNGEAHHGRWAATLDVFWIWVEDVSLGDLNLSVPSPAQLNLDQEYKELLVHPSISYRLVDEQVDWGWIRRIRFAPTAGARYLYFEAKARIKDSRAAALNGLRVIDDTEHYFQILPVGARVEVEINERWSLASKALFGGWSMADSKGGTDYIIDAVVQYAVAESWHVEAGVRWFDMNVEGDDLDYEVDNAWGPLFGVVWSF